jgi:hypothetical protein
VDVDVDVAQTIVFRRLRWQATEIAALPHHVFDNIVG